MYYGTNVTTWFNEGFLLEGEGEHDNNLARHMHIVNVTIFYHR